jgi:hypothetical protein
MYTKTMRTCVLGLVCGLALGCGDDGSSGAGNAGSGPVGGAGGAGGAEPASLLDARYCEVLLGSISGATVDVDVYNTIGLNDCPQADWEALDADAIKSEFMVDAAILNGPRYWTITRFAVGVLQSEEVVTFGGLDMRIGGRISLPISVVTQGNPPYQDRTIQRESIVLFAAGQRVYELVDDTDRVFIMQSYSTQYEPQTLASLETLGERLSLPQGWSYRTRVLSEDLQVEAVDNLATVLQDDFTNTYQLTALTP